jgi:dephospho-CoA kinase
MNRLVVCVCGAMHSGKDVLANRLVGRHGFTALKLAKPLKDSLKVLFDLSDSEVDGPEKDVVSPRWGVAPRKLLQYFGTEVLQMDIQKVVPGIGRTFFAERLATEIAKSDATTNIVVSDVRFLHEVQVLRHRFPHQVVVIRVNRPSLQSTETHVSETEFKTLDADWEVDNDGSLEDFEGKIDQFDFLKKVNKNLDIDFL